MYSLRQGRDRQSQSRLDIIGISTHCRPAILVIISLLIVVLSAALPATAQTIRVIDFGDAKDHGAVFETIENTSNCLVNFRSDPAGQASGIVEIDCTSIDSNADVTVRLFSRILFNSPWVVSDVTFARAEIAVLRIPATGTRNLWTEIKISAPGREVTRAAVTLTGKIDSVPVAICPRHGVAACTTNADCGGGSICSPSCHTCLRAATEPASPRVITVAEIARAGYNTYKTIWETFSRDNPFRRCPTSFVDGPTPDLSGSMHLNCVGSGNKLTRAGWSGAQASFDLFPGAALNPPWVVDSASITPFAGFDDSSVPPDVFITPAPGSRSLATRLRLIAQPHQQVIAAVSIRIKPNSPDPLPNCKNPVGLPALFVCSADEDCPSGGPKPALCSVACGNRCMAP